MSRLVAVSNRVTMPEAHGGRGRPRRGRAGGHAGRAADSGSAGAARSPTAAGRRDASAQRHDVTFATIDLPRDGLRALLRRLLQRHAVAAVPLLRRRHAVLRRAARGLRARQPAVRRPAAAAAARRRPRLGARLSPDPARRASCATRGAHSPLGFFLHIPFPHVEALRALPGYERAGARPARLRPGRVPDRSATSACFRSAVAEVLGSAAQLDDGGVLHGGRPHAARRVPDRRGRGRHPARSAAVRRPRRPCSACRPACSGAAA